jgi:hypothetical protein
MLVAPLILFWPIYWQYEQVIIPTPWFPSKTNLWCGTCVFSFGPETDLTGQMPCWYVVSYRPTMGVAWGFNRFLIGMWYKTNWLNGFWSMWQSCSNLLSRWSRSIFELVGTKLILVFGGCFWKLVDITIGVDASILGKLQHGVVDSHGCRAETTSSNG